MEINYSEVFARRALTFVPQFFSLFFSHKKCCFRISPFFASKFETLNQTLFKKATKMHFLVSCKTKKCIFQLHQKMHFCIVATSSQFNFQYYFVSSFFAKILNKNFLKKPELNFQTKKKTENCCQTFACKTFWLLLSVE